MQSKSTGVSIMGLLSGESENILWRGIQMTQHNAQCTSKIIR